MPASMVGSTGTSPYTFVAPSASSPASLIVVDWFSACGDDDATPTPLIVAVNSITMARQSADAASQSTTVFRDFPDGFPLWSAVDSDLAPASAPTATFTNTGGTNMNFTVGYHYEQPSSRRG